MTFYTTDLIEIQIENSSICNAACPVCVREHKSSDKSWFDETYLELDFFNNIPDEIYQKLKIFYFTGNIGDPCTAPNFLEVCRFVREKNPDMFIKISTNGGMKSPKFWTQLGTILGPKSEVVFAIDGLEDTNHIYRVNVKWDKVMANAQAFIAAGGQAFWQFITFKHNQHQVEQARALATEMGFVRFMMKPSHRFALDAILGTERFNKTAIKIEPPDDQTLIHKVVIHRTAKNLKELKEQSNNSKVDCFVKHTYPSVYIDHLGRVWPCCYLAAGLYVTDRVPDNFDILPVLWKEHGDDKVNLKYHSWDSILSGPFFSAIQDSWTKDYDTGRVITCAITCSKFQSRINAPADMNGIIENA
jgi:sulfatase maturation enzyme AslB (radical SAM superfamily)